MHAVNLFSIMGRYFWLLCLAVTAYNYLVGARSLSASEPADPRASADAVTLRRWFAVASAVPWIVMGWGIVIGGVPNVWYFFRPQDRNPYVWAWFTSILILALYFAYWVFLRGGAQKVVLLKPFEIHWYLSGFRATTRGTMALTEGRVKFYAAMGPIWIAAWIWLMSWMDVSPPK
jgi:hypothetical protein